MRTVYQLHCEAWPDMEAPRDTKVLLDLYDEAEDALSKNPDSTMMVHCSAGVGRTGTFIGLFKLAKDFEDDEVSVRSIDHGLVLAHCNILSISGGGAGSL